MTQFFGALFILLTILATSPSYGWDCSDPAVDCNTLIIRAQASVAQLSSARQRPLSTAKGLSIVEVPPELDAQAYLEDLANTPGIMLVEPALRTEPALSISYDESDPSDSPPVEDKSFPVPEGALPHGPNDPMLGNQSQYLGDVGAELGIDAAWAQLTGSPIIVGVLDSGIQYDHPDLIDNMWVNIGEIPGNDIDDDGNGYVDDVHGYDFFNDQPDPIDDHYHGTHMAGIIGATGNNGIGITGVLWDAQLMALRFTDNDGIGNTAKAVEAIHYAVANGARVINLSWTVSAGSSSGGSQGLKEVIQSYSEDGVIFIAAAGNGGANYEGDNIDEEPVYPAAIKSPNLISVASSSLDSGLAFFSNFGADSVHIVAPGIAILSTLPDDQYGRLTGTSAATAVVSGAAAMILAEAPELGADQLKNLMLNSSTYHQELEGLVQSAGSLNIPSHLAALNGGSSFSTSSPTGNNTSAANSGCTLTALPSSRQSSPSGSLCLAMSLITLFWLPRRFIAHRSRRQ